MYHLPLLPGYGPGINVRSSALSAPIPVTEEVIINVSEAEIEETADESSVEPPTPQSAPELELFTPSTSPAVAAFSDIEAIASSLPVTPSAPPAVRRQSPVDPDIFGEAVFFQYGVVVFFGLDESQERSILDDVHGAGVMHKSMPEERWEVEACHYEVRLHPCSHTLLIGAI